MGLSWQQGPLGKGAVGTFLTAQPMPDRLLFAERLRRRMRVRLGGQWIADSEDVILLHVPGRYPVAYFNRSDVSDGVLVDTDRVTTDKDLGPTAWFTVLAGDDRVERAAWQHIGLPTYAGDLEGRVAFAWRSMDAFFEEDERILGHAADPYHRIDIRKSSRVLEVRQGDHVIARTQRPQVLFESGFAPRWYVPREDIEEDYLTPAEGETFCPYKGLAGYYDIGGAKQAAWYYPEAYDEVHRVGDWVSFEPDKVEVYLDGERLHVEPGQQVSPHGVDRGLDATEVLETRHQRSS